MGMIKACSSLISTLNLSLIQIRKRRKQRKIATLTGDIITSTHNRISHLIVHQPTFRQHSINRKVRRQIRINRDQSGFYFFVSRSIYCLHGNRECGWLIANRLGEGKCEATGKFIRIKACLLRNHLCSEFIRFDICLIGLKENIIRDTKFQSNFLLLIDSHIGRFNFNYRRLAILRNSNGNT